MENEPCYVSIAAACRWWRRHTTESVCSAAFLEAYLRGSTPVVTDGSVIRATICGATKTFVEKGVLYCFDSRGVSVLARHTTESVCSAAFLEVYLRGNTPVITGGSVSRATICGATSTPVNKGNYTFPANSLMLFHVVMI